MNLDRAQLRNLSYILNRAAHMYAGDKNGAGDPDEMYQMCDSWARIFERESENVVDSRG